MEGLRIVSEFWGASSEKGLFGYSMLQYLLYLDHNTGSRENFSASKRGLIPYTGKLRCAMTYKPYNQHDSNICFSHFVVCIEYLYFTLVISF